MINKKKEEKFIEIKNEDIVSMGGDEGGVFYLLRSWRITMPDDQQYRELQRNSIEAIQRVQKENSSFKGKIKWGTDSEYLKKYNIPKLCIGDNGDGMTSAGMISHLNQLGASVRKNQYFNFGCGAKVAVLSKNHKGLIIKSWVKGAKFGSMVLMAWSEDKVGMYKKNGRQTFPITWESAPDFIREAGHGTVVTLLGDTDDQDTTAPTAAYLRTGILRSSRKSTLWLISYLNTKFYSIPPNIEVMCERFEKHRWKNLIIGHEKILEKHTQKREEVRLTGATATIFYSDHDLSSKGGSARSDYLVKGQVATVNQEEIIKLDFDGSASGNTLPKWGLQCLRHQIILVISPDGTFTQNPERTHLNYNGQDSSEFFNGWAEEFKERMPQWLKTKEREKEQAQLQNNDYRNSLRGLASFFKKTRYKKAEEGDPIEEEDIRKSSQKKKRIKPVPPPPPPPIHLDKDGYGEIKELFGTKIEQSQFRGRKLNLVNEFPDTPEVYRGKTAYPLEFIKEGYRVEVNVESTHFDDVVDFFYKGYKKVQKETIRAEAIKLAKVSIVQQVAFIYNRMKNTDEEIEASLGKVSLAGMIANIESVCERLRRTFDTFLSKKSPEVKLLPTLEDSIIPTAHDDSSIHKYNPDKFIFKNGQR